MIRAIGALNAPVAGWARLPLGAILGYAGSWGLPPSGIWPAFVLALCAVACLFAGTTGARRAAALGWAFGTGYFCGAWPWIMEPFWVDAAAHGWMAPFALVFLSAGMALYWAVAFGLAHALGQGARSRVLALAVTLPLAELARGYLFTGFPWAAPAQIWIDVGVAQWLSLIGPYGLTLLTVLVAVAPAAALVQPRPGAVALSLVPLAALLAGGALLTANRPEVAGTGQTVRLIQPNAPQHEKWDPARIPVFFQRQIGYTAAWPRPDMIVWPETAIPTLLNNAAPTLDVIAEAAGGVPVVLGLQREEDGRYYNSLAYLDDTGAVAEIYDKHHLVPFGEYIPLAPLAARLGIAGLAQRAEGGYAAGPGPRLVDLPVGAGLPLICYEAVFPQDTRGAPGGRPDFLMQITNDAWFGQRIGPFQHLAQARMRTIEQGLPLMRAANTGVSAMIDPHGRITAQLDLGQAGFVDAELPAPLAPTLYARMGDGPVAGFLTLFVAFGLLWRRTRRAAGK